MALLLAMLVLGIVGVSRALSGPADLMGSPTGPVEPLALNPSEPNDGLLSPGTTVSPTSVPGTSAPEIVARDFTTNWIAHTGDSAENWHSRLIPFSTAKLAGKLANVDPAIVPADRVTGAPIVIPHAETIVEVMVPLDSGKLRLRMVAADGRWLVDGLDWERS